MSLFNKHSNKKHTLVTHNGKFHSDDIFATAALSILLDGNIEVTRTRDEELIKNADFVYDVGGIHNDETNRFDHHQIGGAGKRDNGIPYASFGLVWKKYGTELCGSKEVSDTIDQELVQPIDATDNGMDMYTSIHENLHPVTIGSFFSSLRPTWKEAEDYDTPFFESVSVAKKFLERKIIREKDALEASAIVKKAYEDAEDKRLIILDDKYPARDILMSYPEPLYLVGPNNDNWGVICINKEKDSFLNRKDLPAEWAGLRDQELANVTGVPDAIFCHNGRFLAVARSKEGAVKLAQMALLA